MGRLIFSMSVSLDGFVDTPAHSLDWVRVDEDLHREFNAEARSKHSVRVDSRANVSGWRARLSPADIERVRSGTQDVWPLYYSDEDW